MFLLPISLSSFFNKETTFFHLSEMENINNENKIIVYIKDKDLYLDLEDYVVGVVAAEMPALFKEEALKAQAVAARSFAVSQASSNLITITSGVSSQVFQTKSELKDKWNDDYERYYERVKNSVQATESMVITRNGKILKTYYFSMSNGQTEDSITVFNENTFSSVPSPYENENLKNFKYEKQFSEAELLKLLGLKYINIQNIDKNSTNHVNAITISGKTYTGIEFRSLLNLRSTDFDINKIGDKYIITTRGYGHGVGMSQYGANEMAKNGYNYKEILNYYYQNTNLIKI